jgi:hypothetical protein
MKKIGGVLEGLILLAIGLYASLLVFFGDYWRFLNPKFKWLTALAAIALMVLGVTATMRYAVRGIVKRDPRMDRLDQFAIVRNTVFCCLADSVGMGFRVQYNGRVDELTDGQWVEVYGTMGGTPETMPDLGLRIKGMLLTVLNETHILVADKVNGTKTPEIPYIIDIRSTEPYAY